MKEAFKKAGLKPASERLADLAAEVLDSAGRDFEAATEAMFARVCADEALALEAFSRFKQDALRPWLATAAAATREAATVGVELRGIVPPREHSEGKGHRRRDTHHSAALPFRRPGSAFVGEVRANPPRVSPSVLAQREASVRLTIFDTFRTELGKPLGDCTAGELRDMAKRSHRRGWFYEALAQPMADLPTPVRTHWAPDDVAALWEKSERANSAGAVS